MSRELRERDEMFYTSWSQATEVNINNSCVLLHFFKTLFKIVCFFLRAKLAISATENEDCLTVTFEALAVLILADWRKICVLSWRLG